MYGGDIVEKIPLKKFALRKSLVQDRVQDKVQDKVQSFGFGKFSPIFFFAKSLKMSCMVEKL